MNPEKYKEIAELLTDKRPDREAQLETIKESLIKLLEKNNIKGKVYEVDLKEKGIFFRVRAGVFASPEEAKAKTVKIE